VGRLRAAFVPYFFFKGKPLLGELEIARRSTCRAFFQALLEFSPAFFVDVVAYSLVNEATAVAFVRDTIKQRKGVFRERDVDPSVHCGILIGMW